MAATRSAFTLAIAALACTNAYGDLEFQKDGAGGKGSGGNAGVDDGASSGGSAAGCGQYEISCGGQCVSGTDTNRCGGCTNDCSAQGVSGGFQCIDMQCGCTQNAQCSVVGANCSTAAGRCVCGTTQCQAGESCARVGAQLECSCNGQPGCTSGQICCQSPAGCADRC